MLYRLTLKDGTQRTVVADSALNIKGVRHYIGSGCHVRLRLPATDIAKETIDPPKRYPPTLN